MNELNRLQFLRRSVSDVPTPILQVNSSIHSCHFILNVDEIISEFRDKLQKIEEVWYVLPSVSQVS